MSRVKNIALPHGTLPENRPFDDCHVFVLLWSSLLPVFYKGIFVAFW